jgi:hypothetical protein
VSFSVALAGIAIAEEAGLYRLSLMCEIAASNLLSSSNVVEALTMCTKQKDATGNSLSRLREVAISVVLKGGPRGIYDMDVFKLAMEERRTSIVPTLLTGAMDALSKYNEKRGEEKTTGAKREFSLITESICDE